MRSRSTQSYWGDPSIMSGETELTVDLYQCCVHFVVSVLNPVFSSIPKFFLHHFVCEEATCGSAVVYWSGAYVEALIAGNYYSLIIPGSSLPQLLVLNPALHQPVLHQHPPARATAEHFYFRSVDKTLVWVNSLVLWVPKAIPGEVIW